MGLEQIVTDEQKIQMTINLLRRYCDSPIARISEEELASCEPSIMEFHLICGIFLCSVLHQLEHFDDPFLEQTQRMGTKGAWAIQNYNERNATNDGIIASCYARGNELAERADSPDAWDEIEDMMRVVVNYQPPEFERESREMGM
jgi:hypothetical protein